MRPSGISEKILSTAFYFLCDWEDGLLTLDDCLDRLRRENGPERAAVASLLFEYFRHKGFIDEISDILVDCGLNPLYARHPFDRLIIFCAATPSPLDTLKTLNLLRYTEE